MDDGLRSWALRELSCTPLPYENPTAIDKAGLAMPHGTPRDHHYVPQFYLRLFAADPAGNKLWTVAKNDEYAIHALRSIKNLGFERDLYVHLINGVPVSVESVINENVETPLSLTETWAKIASNRADVLDKSDKGNLYSLIRHLQARNVHARATSRELMNMASDPKSSIPFTDGEREMYEVMRREPGAFDRFMNYSASTLRWDENSYRKSALSVYRSPIALRTSTTPVITLNAPAHPALHLPLPGQTPFQYMLVLNRFTAASLVFGDFDDAFMNIEIPVDAARGFNRHCLAHFAHFSHIRHLVADDESLKEDMLWAPYNLVHERPGDVKYRRRAAE